MEKEGIVERVLQDCLSRRLLGDDWLHDVNRSCEPIIVQIVEADQCRIRRAGRHQASFQERRVVVMDFNRFMLIHTTRKQHSRENNTIQYRPGLR
jgi:hypothetical protein